MTIYEALSREHREFERLLDRLLEASKAEDESWKSILDELRRAVVVHAHAEEAILYNALREANEGKDLVMHGYGEHAKTETEIRTLGVAKMVDATWTSLVEKIRKDLLHHIKEEEERIFGAARQVFSEEEATQLGVAYERMKTEMAPDGDSMLESTIDLVSNLLPPRLTAAFRKNLGTGRSQAS